MAFTPYRSSDYQYEQQTPTFSRKRGTSDGESHAKYLAYRPLPKKTKGIGKPQQIARTEIFDIIQSNILLAEKIRQIYCIASRLTANQDLANIYQYTLTLIADNFPNKPNLEEMEQCKLFAIIRAIARDILDEYNVPTTEINCCHISSILHRLSLYAEQYGSAHYKVHLPDIAGITIDLVHLLLCGDSKFHTDIAHIYECALIAISKLAQNSLLNSTRAQNVNLGKCILQMVEIFTATHSQNTNLVHANFSVLNSLVNLSSLLTSSNENITISDQYIIRILLYLSNVTTQNVNDCYTILNICSKLAKCSLLKHIDVEQFSKCIFKFLEVLANQNIFVQNPIFWYTTTINNIGILSQYGTLQSSDSAQLSTYILPLLELIEKNIPTGKLLMQNIMFTFLGLGKLASYDMLQPTDAHHILTNYIIPWILNITAITEQEYPPSKLCSSIIFSLGEIATAWQQEMLKLAELPKLINLMCNIIIKNANNNRTNSQDCAFAIRGLSQLTKYRILNKDIPEINQILLVLITTLLNHLTQNALSQHTNSIDISDAVSAIGELAELGVLANANKTLIEEPILKLLQILPNLKDNSLQYNVITLSGVQALVIQQIIGNSNLEILQMYILQIFNKIVTQKKDNCTNLHHCAEGLKILGTFAKNKILHSHTPQIHELNQLILQLATNLAKKSKFATAHTCCDTLLGLEKLLKHAVFNMTEESTTIALGITTSLAEKAEQNLTVPQDLSIILYVLGKLTGLKILQHLSTKESTELNRNISQIVTKLLEQPMQSQINAQDASYILFGLGMLMDNEVLQMPNIAALCSLVNNALNKIATSEAIAQAYVHTLLGIAKIMPIIILQPQHIDISNLQHNIELIINKAVSSSFNHQECASILWSLGILQITGFMQISTDCIQKLHTSFDYTKVDQKTIIVYMQGMSFLGYGAFLTDQIYKESTSPTSSYIHLCVSEKLNQHKIDHQNEVFILGFTVDIYISHLRLIVELDGFYHQSAQKQHSDAIRDKCLEKYNYQVYRVPITQTSHIDDMVESILRIISDLEQSRTMVAQTFASMFYPNNQQIPPQTNKASTSSLDKRH